MEDALVGICRYMVGIFLENVIKVFVGVLVSVKCDIQFGQVEQARDILSVLAFFQKQIFRMSKCLPGFKVRNVADFAISFAIGNGIFFLFEIQLGQGKVGIMVVRINIS